MGTQKTVAIVGASADRGKFGNKSLRAHLKQGWTVYPVNPRGGQIEGLTVYRTLDETPRPLQRVSLYLPPEVGLTIIDAVARTGAAEFFVNPGSESADLLAAARRHGLDPIQACSIVDVGESPAGFG